MVMMCEGEREREALNPIECFTGTQLVFIFHRQRAFRTRSTMICFSWPVILRGFGPGASRR